MTQKKSSHHNEWSENEIVCVKREVWNTFACHIIFKKKETKWKRAKGVPKLRVGSQVSLPPFLFKFVMCIFIFSVMLGCSFACILISNIYPHGNEIIQHPPNSINMIFIFMFNIKTLSTHHPMTRHFEKVDNDK